MLAHKLAQLPPNDSFLAADDNALAFLLTRGDSLQPGVPAVFFGVNSVELANMAVSRPGFTGVLEAVSIAPTLELMTRLQPEATRLVALVDGTPSGQADLMTFKQQAPSFPDHDFEVLSLTSMDFDELGRRLEALGAESSLLLLSAYKDTTGRRVLFQEGLDIILDHALQPVFHLWQHGLGDGLLGGVVISHEEEARQAALMALRVLAGETAETIPFLRASRNQTVIDETVMQRFGLDHRDLPAGTILLNRSDNLLDRYRTPILIVMLCMVLLLGGILFLAQMNRRLRLAQDRLRESEMRYAGLFSGAHLVMLLVNARDGRIMEANQAAGRFTGAHPRRFSVWESMI